MKTAPTNKKVRELIGMVKEGKLLPRPEFQRRLVWTHKDKDHFLDTILRGFPFPEIYLADGTVDLESGEGTQLLVDGLQRVNTLIEYFDASANLRLQTVTPYKDLSEELKRSFLQYDVAVRDLGTVHRDQLVEVFRRINATKYSLLDIEVNNAVYAGALKQFAENLASHEFFTAHGVFNSSDFKRMGDLRYALTIIITLTAGYFNRDDYFEEFLGRFNDNYEDSDEMSKRVLRCFDFINECGFSPNSRIWKKAELFTVIVELDSLFRDGIDLQPSDVVNRLTTFFDAVEKRIDTTIGGLYYKASIQATNDRLNRVRRGVIISGIISGNSLEIIYENLSGLGFITTPYEMVTTTEESALSIEPKEILLL